MEMKEFLPKSVTLRDAGLAGLCAVAALAAPFATLAWAVAVDTAGLAGSVPAFVFTVALPAATVALVPAAATRALATDTGALKPGVATALLAGSLLAYGCWTTMGNAIC